MVNTQFEIGFWFIKEKTVNSSGDKTLDMHNTYDCRLLNMIIDKDELLFVYNIINQLTGKEHSDIVIDNKRKDILYKHFKDFDNNLLELNIESINVDILDNYVNGIKDSFSKDIEDDKYVSMFNTFIKNTFKLTELNLLYIDSYININTANSVYEIDKTKLGYYDKKLSCSNVDINMVSSINALLA